MSDRAGDAGSRTRDAGHGRRLGGRIGRDRVQGAQRPHRRRPGDPLTGETPTRTTRLRRPAGRARRELPSAGTPAGPPTVELVFDEDFNAYGIEMVQGAARRRGSRRSRGDRQPPSGRPTRIRWCGTRGSRDLASAGRRAVIAVVTSCPKPTSPRCHRVRSAAGRHRPAEPAAPSGSPASDRPTSPAGLAATQHLLSARATGASPTSAVRRPAPATRPGCTATAPPWRRLSAEIDDAYVRTGNFLYDNGLREGLALLDLARPPTASVRRQRRDRAWRDRGGPLTRAAGARGPQCRRLRRHPAGPACRRRR